MRDRLDKLPVPGVSVFPDTCPLSSLANKVLPSLTLPFDFSLNSLDLTHSHWTQRAIYNLPFHSHLAHSHIQLSEQLWAGELAFLTKREMRMKMLASIYCPACYTGLQNISFLLLGNDVSLKLKAQAWYIFNPDYCPHPRWCFSKISGQCNDLHAEA